jgi:import inner membrane translocase subunit TIM23
MLCSPPTLRTAAISCRMQPTFLAPNAYHTSSPTPLRAQDSSSSKASRRVPIVKRHISIKKPSLTPSTLRYASSTTAPSSGTSPIPEADPNSEHLTWNTFFKLRKTRRWYQLGSSVGSGINGFIIGAEVLTRTDTDKIVAQFPIDPFISLGLITFACGGLGWLAGPVVGNAVFNWRNKKFRSQMDDKEKEFYRRIKRYRVDPSASSMANPVPGESPGCLASLGTATRY